MHAVSKKPNGGFTTYRGEKEEMNGSGALVVLFKMIPGYSTVGRQMGVERSFACDGGRSKRTLCSGGEADVNWPIVLSQKMVSVWTRPSVVRWWKELMEKKEVSLSYGHPKTGWKRAAMVRLKEVCG